MPSLNLLEPWFRPMAHRMVTYARRRWPGAGFVVTSTRRTFAEQRRLFERAQAGQNNGLPATPPGMSDHEVGLAFDFARLNQDPLTDPLLPLAGAHWAAMGGRWWAGDPVHFAAPRDRPRSRKRARRRR